jgi:hypothetical protein
MNLENSTLKLLHWRWKYLVPAIIFAVAFYAVDAWVWFLPILSVLVLLLSLPCFLIAAIVCLFRKCRTSAFKVMASIGILFLGIVAVGITNHIRNNLTESRAVKLGEACIAYHAKYHRYPERLDDLVPEFISSVPSARIGIFGKDDFDYAPHEAHEPFLYYECLPPFGHCYYYVESRCWRFLD